MGDKRGYGAPYEEQRYLFLKLVQNPESRSTRVQFYCSLKQVGLSPIDYQDPPEGVRVKQRTGTRKSTRLAHVLPKPILPGSLKVFVNNRLQKEGESYTVNYLRGSVMWLSRAPFQLDEEDYLRYECLLSPV